VVHEAHALAAAAVRGLEHHGVADALGRGEGLVVRVALPPGVMGTPAAAIFARAAVLEPMASIALAGGPMKVMPAASHAAGSSRFSERKP
jgi:hypothetical protein